MNEKNQLISSHEDDTAQLNETIKALQEEIQQKDLQIQDLSDQLQKLEHSVEEKNEAVQTLESQLDNMQFIARERDEIKSQLQESAENVQELLSQKEVLYENIRKLKSDQSGDKAIIARLESKITTLQGKGLKDNVEVDMLRKKIDDISMPRFAMKLVNLLKL